MHKKIFLIVFLITSIFLYGCNTKGNFQYEFEKFYGTFNTKNKFTLNNTNLNGLGYNLMQNNIINIYKQEIEEGTGGFSESIIISKKISDKDLQTFSKENTTNIDIPGLKISKGKTLEINCENGSFDLIYYNGKYDLNQYNVYISNGFMKVNQDIYIISYATLDEKNRNEFSSTLKDIKCK